MAGSQLKLSPPIKRRKQTKKVAVSGNKTAPRLDRRVRRSRDLLGDALVALMQEKPLDDITVQEVLDRAGISRATFYTHYSGKEDLLFSDAEDFFTAMAGLLLRDPSQRLTPVTEMLSHLREARPFYLALVSSGKKHEILELGEGLFARGIVQRLTALQPQLSAERREQLAHLVAGAFMGLLNWWLQHQLKEPPEQMDNLFHEAIWRGLSGMTCEARPAQGEGAA